MTNQAYDVVCVGGAVTGSSVAYHLSENVDFDGSILVVERDRTYSKASTTLSAASIREQFSHPLNIKASQFGMDFIESFHELVEVDGESPDLGFRGTGYLFLAAEGDSEALLRRHQAQVADGAGAQMLSSAELGERFPYLRIEALGGGTLGSQREGSFDAWAMLQGMKQRAKRNGVTYIEDEVVDVEMLGDRVTAVRLGSGSKVVCRHVVNAAGPRAADIAAMVRIPLPVEPRVRSVFRFDCRSALEGDVPLTVTPEGVYFRQEGAHFIAGATPRSDGEVDPDDFTVRADEFDDLVWPVLAKWVPQFDRVSVLSSWAGHYAFNTLDQNMVIGHATSCANFILANGFSGHGLQHAPAVGRAVSELITYGRYTTLDLSQLGYQRIVDGTPTHELAIV